MQAMIFRFIPFNFFKIFPYDYVYVTMCVFAPMCNFPGRPEKVRRYSVLGRIGVVNYTMWLLKNRFWSFGRMETTVLSISPTPPSFFTLDSGNSVFSGNVVLVSSKVSCRKQRNTGRLAWLCGLWPQSRIALPLCRNMHHAFYASSISKYGRRTKLQLPNQLFISKHKNL